MAEKTIHLKRTSLYASGASPVNMIQAVFYNEDVLIYDLEDSVPAVEKDAARFLVYNMFSPRLLAERVGVIGQQDDARTPQQTGKGVTACPLFQFCQPGKHGLRRCADFPQHKDNGSH